MCCLYGKGYHVGMVTDCIGFGFERSRMIGYRSSEFFLENKVLRPFFLTGILGLPCENSAIWLAIASPTWRFHPLLFVGFCFECVWCSATFWTSVGKFHDFVAVVCVVFGWVNAVFAVAVAIVAVLAELVMFLEMRKASISPPSATHRHTSALACGA